jgi:hypothetical protein
VSAAEERDVKMSNGGSKGYPAARSTVVSTTGISKTLADVAAAAE